MTQRNEEELVRARKNFYDNAVTHRRDYLEFADLAGNKLRFLCMLMKVHCSKERNSNRHYHFFYYLLVLWIILLQLSKFLKLTVILSYQIYTKKNDTHWTWFRVYSEFGWEIPSYFMTKLAVYSNPTSIWIIIQNLTICCAALLHLIRLVFHQEKLS